MKPIVQISLDLANIDEALETAALARRAGVEWIEAGTPLILAEGLHGVKELRAAFPGVPIVADLKTMDGGYLEAEIMAKAGATQVVVIARAHPEVIKCAVRAGRDFGGQSETSSITVIPARASLPNLSSLKSMATEMKIKPPLIHPRVVIGRACAPETS
jgi:3-keto-L-gulonate-6-phosphate decarboxylase